MATMNFYVCYLVMFSQSRLLILSFLPILFWQI